MSKVITSSVTDTSVFRMVFLKMGKLNPSQSERTVTTKFIKFIGLFTLIQITYIAY